MLVYLLLLSVGCSYLDSIGLAMLLSVVINYVIDVFGYEEFHGHIRRSKDTHSLSTSSILGVFIGLAVTYFMNYSLVLGVLSGLTTSLSHLFLDSLTMGGIYMWQNYLIRLMYFYSIPP